MFVVHTESFDVQNEVSKNLERVSPEMPSIKSQSLWIQTSMFSVKHQTESDLDQDSTLVCPSSGCLGLWLIHIFVDLLDKIEIDT